MGSGAFLIGAAARDLIFEYVYDAKIQRATEDLDFGVAVATWDDYQRLKTLLLDKKKFREDPKQEQRIWWTGTSPQMRIDLVPFGGLETPEARIAFPPSGDFTMSTLGFREVSEDLWSVDISDDLRIEVASLAGIVVLKFVAYNDRPEQRHRDIQDIFFIAENYLDAGNEDRLYDSEAGDADLLDNENFDYKTAGARLLGRDIASLVNADTRSIILTTLGYDPESGSLDKLNDIVNRNRFRDPERDHRTVNVFQELKRGIEDRGL